MASETISNYESCPFITEEPRLSWDQLKRDTNSIFVRMIRMKWIGYTKREEENKAISPFCG